MSTVLYYGSTTQIHSGAAQWMLRLADSMRSFDHRTIAVLPDESEIATQYRDAGIETRVIYSEPLRRRRSFPSQLLFIFWSLIAIVQLTVVIRRHDVDIIHVNDIRYCPALLAARLGGARSICHVRACFESRIVRKWLGQFVVSNADEIICVSKRTREVMFEEVDLDKEHVKVLRDAVPSPDRFEELPDGGDFRAKCDLNDDTILTVQISKLTKNKGQDRLLDVAARLEADHPDIHFAIVGGSVEGHEEFHNEVKNRAASLENVSFVGFCDEIAPVLAASDILVHLPRHDDPFPGVVLEGMLAGLPIIGSRSGGIPEQIEDGKTGMLVAKRNEPETIASTIARLADSPTLRYQLGDNGRSQALERFSTREYFAELDARYRQLTR